MIQFRGFEFRIPKSRDYDIVVASQEKLEKISQEQVVERISLIRDTAEQLLKSCLIDQTKLEELQESLDYEYDFAITGLNTLTEEYNKKVAEHRTKIIEPSLKDLG